MSHMFKNSLAAFALLAGLSAAHGQEQIIGSGVYRAGPSMFVPIMANVLTPASGTNVQYGGQIGFWNSGSMQTSATNRQMPIPITGVLSGLFLQLGSAQTTGSVTSNINAADQTITCSFNMSVSPYLCSDTTHTDPVNAGDLFQWHYVPGTAWTQASNAGQISVLLQSSDLEGAMFTALGVVAPATTAAYLGLGGVGAGSTDAAMSAPMPVPGTVNSLYVYPGGTDNLSGVTHSYTLVKNGTNTAMTCSNPTPTVNGGAGCCVDVTSGHHIGGATGPACGSTSTVSFVAGDTLSIFISCPGANCNSANLTVSASVAYTPTTPGQAILTNIFGTGASTSYGAPLDTRISNTQSAVVQLIPSLSGRTATFSNLISCSAVALTGTNTRTTTFQVGAVPPALPASSSIVTTWGIGAACPGYLGGTPAFFGGPIDTTHTVTATSGQTVDHFFQATAGGISGNSKTSIVAVIR